MHSLCTSHIFQIYTPTSSHFSTTLKGLTVAHTLPFKCPIVLYQTNDIKKVAIKYNPKSSKG